MAVSQPNPEQAAQQTPAPQQAAPAATPNPDIEAMKAQLAELEAQNQKLKNYETVYNTVAGDPRLSDEVLKRLNQPYPGYQDYQQQAQPQPQQQVQPQNNGEDLDAKEVFNLSITDPDAAARKLQDMRAKDRKAAIAEAERIMEKKMEPFRRAQLDQEWAAYNSRLSQLGIDMNDPSIRTRIWQRGVQFAQSIAARTGEDVNTVYSNLSPSMYVDSAISDEIYAAGERKASKAKQQETNQQNLKQVAQGEPPAAGTSAPAQRQTGAEASDLKSIFADEFQKAMQMA